MELIEGNLMVELDFIGEGLNGDYSENDPKDVPLLRFTVCQKEGDDWVQVEDASYCTLLDTGISNEIKKRALRHIMDEIKDALESGASVKKLCERLSWIKPSDFAGDPPPES